MSVSAAAQGNSPAPERSAGDRFLTAEELARVLPCSSYWLMQQARRTDPEALPSYRGGKRVVFILDEAVAWFMRTQRRNPPAPMPRRRRRPRQR
jgi:hypothetical protein